MDDTKASEIAQLNDTFRRSRVRLYVTRGVEALDDVQGVLREVTHFEAFTEDNDPYGEHDFGSLERRGETVFWKIDYYDQTMDHWEDPRSPECKRVLTVMLASEW